MWLLLKIEPIYVPLKMHKWNALVPGIRAPQISLYNLVEWKDNGMHITIMTYIRTILDYYY